MNPANDLGNVAADIATVRGRLNHPCSESRIEEAQFTLKAANDLLYEVIDHLRTDYRHATVTKHNVSRKLNGELLKMERISVDGCDTRIHITDDGSRGAVFYTCVFPKDLPDYDPEYETMSAYRSVGYKTKREAIDRAVGDHLRGSYGVK